MSNAFGAVSWQSKVAQKSAESFAKTPKEWILPTFCTSGLRLPLEDVSNNVLSIPRKSQILTPRELNITEDYDVPALLQALAEGRLSALEVTIAFSKRAAIAQQLTSCLTETFFQDAQDRARYLDEYRYRNGKGPLRGLPISIKDGFQVKGYDASIGCVSLIGENAIENSCLVDMLLDLGAILYVKTNVPQTLQVLDSHNNIFGLTLNPLNTALTPGGSSGGEGALIALRGSLLGVGTDIGGSIRVPALCCGTYGFKPSTQRIPYGKQSSYSEPGFTGFLACAGPLASDFAALETFMKAMVDKRPAMYDVTCLDIPWRPVDELADGKLRLGILAEDPVYPLHPQVKRALVEASERLRSAGFEVVQLLPQDCQIAEAAELAFALLSLNQARTTAMISASGEPLVPSVAAKYTIPSTSGLYVTPEISTLDPFNRFNALEIKRRKLKDSWRRVWQDFKLEAVIAPGAQSTAVPHDTFGCPVYTVFQNTLDFPACMLPFSAASKIADPIMEDMLQGQYGPKYIADITNGAPCSIQVFTSNLRDEECLSISGIIDKYLRE